MVGHVHSWGILPTCAPWWNLGCGIAKCGFFHWKGGSLAAETSKNRMGSIPMSCDSLWDLSVFPYLKIKRTPLATGRISHVFSMVNGEHVTRAAKNCFHSGFMVNLTLEAPRAEYPNLTAGWEVFLQLDQACGHGFQQCVWHLPDDPGHQLTTTNHQGEPTMKRLRLARSNNSPQLWVSWSNG